MARSEETLRVFTWDGDVATVANAWAAERRFELGPTDDGVLLYGGLVQGTNDYPMAWLCVSIARKGGQVELRFWIASGTAMLRIFLLLIPSSMGIESGGFMGFANRRRARVAANDLLGRFGQPPIT